MQGREMETAHGSLQYEIREDGVVITGYRGKDIVLEIPDRIREKPVTVVGKKAFLGAKELQQLTLPGSIAAIQEWAFACCSELRTLILPRKRLLIGQGILKDCFRLEQILSVNSGQILSGSPAGSFGYETEISRLFAAVTGSLDAFYLFDPLAAGSESWLEQWDARMLSLMAQADEEGFSKMLLCGEEDYGSRENDLDYYLEQRRRFKVRLALLRLMNDTGLAPDIREGLLSYLRDHTKGGASEETWKVVLEEHGDERAYYQFLLDNGCIHDGNFDAVLEDMGERHTEMKAFLMNARSAPSVLEDAFAALAFEV
ncbi:MAG: leucine-rich repeat domain-containing protein [Blautia sp.]|nr:leucine-rich repeat domain-containing protein [Blautia sp.]MCM1202348.1 leucine-rich repeat domain-containing protein [Bacteroides fragilis]